jgi:hypothetical protein
MNEYIPFFAQFKNNLDNRISLNRYMFCMFNKYRFRMKRLYNLFYLKFKSKQFILKIKIYIIS